MKVLNTARQSCLLPCYQITHYALPTVQDIGKYLLILLMEKTAASVWLGFS